MEEILRRLGLEEKEAKVYLALLSTGECTATKISQKTVLDRTLMYQITNKLIDKGLVSFVVKNNVKYFIAANPKKLLEDLKDKEHALSSILPRLNALTKLDEQEMKVEVYRGKEGFRAILKDILRVGKDYIAFGEEGRMQQIIPIELGTFLKRIELRGIKERVIVREDLRHIAFKSKTSVFKFIPKEYLSPALTAVYGDKVVTILFNEPYYAILTTSKDMAQSYRNHFELLWRIAKK
jgi:HTH-type transcriptional regulator, sugar sensing transcriptional regulator